MIDTKFYLVGHGGSCMESSTNVGLWVPSLFVEVAHFVGHLGANDGA